MDNEDPRTRGLAAATTVAAIALLPVEPITAVAVAFVGAACTIGYVVRHRRGVLLAWLGLGPSDA